MKKILISLGIISMFCLALVSASCYQESANVGTSCGGLATGNYSVTNSGGAYGDVTYGYIDINYIKPVGVASAIWKVKHGNLGTYTVNIPSDCFNYYPDRIFLRLVTRTYIYPANPTSYGQCFNGNWNNITQIAYSDENIPSNYYDKADYSNRAFDGTWNTNTYFADNGNTWNSASSGLYINSAWYEEGITWDNGLPICTPSWVTGTWSACINNSKTRVVTDLNNCGVDTGKPTTTQACVSPCVENWQCSNWSSCLNRRQTRICTDSNSCGTFKARPTLSQTCIPVCNTSADTNYDGKISMSELLSSLYKWQSGSLDTNSLYHILDYWRLGIGC